jgi:hypothetical protein
VLSVCGSAWFNLPVPALTTHTTTRQRGYSAQLQTYCEVRRLGRPPLTASTVSRVKSLPICCTRALSCCGPFLDPISLHTCGLSLHPATHRGSETPISKTTSKKKACGSLISRPPTLSLSPPALRFAERALGPSHSSTGPDHTPPLPPPPPLVGYKATRHRARGGASQVCTGAHLPEKSHIPHPTVKSKRTASAPASSSHAPPRHPQSPKAPKPVPTGSRTRKLQYPIIGKHHLWDSDRHSTPCSRPNPNIRIVQSLELSESIKSCATPLDGGPSGVVASAFLNLDSDSFHSPSLAFLQP